MVLYKDKNNVYLLHVEGGCIYSQCVKILKLNPQKIVVIDSEYITDGKEAYCMRNGWILRFDLCHPKRFYYAMYKIDIGSIF